jgi:hypothetical protein
MVLNHDSNSIGVAMKRAPQVLLPCLVMMAVAGCGSGKKPAAAAPPKVGTVTAQQ